LDSMADMFYELSRTTSNTELFVENTKQRMKMLDDLREQSQYADSPAKQSEIVFQALSLIAAQNEDQIQQTLGADALIANEREYAKKATEHFSRIGREYLDSEGAITGERKDGFKDMIGIVDPSVDMEADSKKYAENVKMYNFRY